jgi:tetratricopeptide (TPR) repeat protein
MLKKALLLLLVFILMSGISNAEIKTFVHTVRQPFSGSQSPDDARVAATHKAKREVLEMAGTYLETLTIVEDGRLTKDQILALASGVLKTEIISQKPYISGEGYGVIVKVRVKVDTGQVEQNLKRLMNDKKAMKQLVALRKRDKELLERIERLEEADRRLSKTKETQGVKKIRDELKKDFQQTTKGLDAVALRKQAMELLDKNLTYREIALQGLSQETIELLQEAIELLNKAIFLDPSYAEAYLTRGGEYRLLKQYVRAIQDFDKAIELAPSLTNAYYARGDIYRVLKQYDRAIKDFDKTIELAPSYAMAYTNRGDIYSDLKQYARAIKDFDKAIELSIVPAMDYHHRGKAYLGLKQYARAIKDFDKAIELWPFISWFYNSRG